jgi:hypothetical protein
MSSGVTAHSSVPRLLIRRHREPRVPLLLVVRLARWAMLSESIEGHEWGTYVALATFLWCGTRDCLKAAKPMVTECPIVPKSERGNGVTQTDRNVCRWLADHGKGNPVRGRAGEGAQVTRWAVPVRYARCGAPKQDWSSSEMSSEVVTGERLEIERLTSSFGGGLLEKCSGSSNSLASYPTARTVLKQRWRERSLHRL